MYPVEVRVEALALLRAGLSGRQVGRRLGVRERSVTGWARLAGMVMQQGRRGGVAGAVVPVEVMRAQPVFSEPDPDPGAGWVDAHGRLTEAARVLIQVRLAAGASRAGIARELGVHRCTVGREVTRGSVDGVYRARWSHGAMLHRRARPKPGKLAPGSRLRAAVTDRLNQRFSPQQVSHDLRVCFPGRDDMQVSHETIYQALYVQGRGSLREELAVLKALRRGGTRRVPRSKLPPRRGRSWIGEDAHISRRPAEAADRAVPGHWEGDLVIGAGGANALITLVERATRFTLIRRLPAQHDAATVTTELIAMTRDLPEALRRTLTWDQGCEMARHADFTLATDVQVYFCDPHSPWQRGSNENTNGLIRDYFPKGTDFSHVTDDAIAQCQHELNIRPRQTLDWERPATRLNQLLTVAPTT